MGVDVSTQVEIARPPEEVAGYAVEPDNAPEWYVNIKAAEWLTERPLRVGSRFAFAAAFLGRRLEYVYEVREHVPGERFVMSTAEGPFPMETTYTWEPAPGGRTLMTLRNRGEPRRLGDFTSRMIGRAIARANRRDLDRLRSLLERHPQRQPVESIDP